MQWRIAVILVIELEIYVNSALVTLNVVKSLTKQEILVY